VLVQTRSSLDETRDFLATAASTDFVAGVVGWVDLTDPALAENLAEIRDWPGGKVLVGVRHQVHDEPDPDWLLRPEVQRGIAAVGRAGLAYDLLVRARELPAAAATVRRNPEVRFVVDHLAKPRIADGPVDPPWEAGLRPLAGEPNVFCKLSGMVTEADWSEWTPADLSPYIGKALAWFGPERCMFGSDWPVCLLAAGYGRVLTALEEALTGLDEAGQARVLGGTAEEFYRLG
jgi:L-fuconolactonase